MTFKEFCALCRELEGTRSRLSKTAATAEFLCRLAGDEIPSAVAFLTGHPFPASDPRVLEVSWATLSELLDTVRPAPLASSLTLLDVARSFAAVAQASGPGSRRVKAERLGTLFGRATVEEREVLQKVLLGEMRIGQDNTVTLEGIRLQIAKQRGRRTCAGLRVLVRRHLDGSHSVWWGTRCFGRYTRQGRALGIPQVPPRAALSA